MTRVTRIRSGFESQRNLQKRFEQHRDSLTRLGIELTQAGESFTVQPMNRRKEPFTTFDLFEAYDEGVKMAKGD